MITLLILYRLTEFAFQDGIRHFLIPMLLDPKRSNYSSDFWKDGMVRTHKLLYYTMTDISSQAGLETNAVSEGLVPFFRNAASRSTIKTAIKRQCTAARQHVRLKVFVSMIVQRHC
jgi:hypothetical protein